jgi:hypothetical protein
MCAYCYGDTTCKLVAPRTEPVNRVSLSLIQVIIGYIIKERQGSWSEVRNQCRSAKKKYFSSDQSMA